MPPCCFQSGIVSHPYRGQFNLGVYLSILLFYVSDFCDPEKICSLWLDDWSTDKEFSEPMGEVQSSHFQVSPCSAGDIRSPFRSHREVTSGLWGTVVITEETHSPDC